MSIWWIVGSNKWEAGSIEAYPSYQPEAIEGYFLVVSGDYFMQNGRAECLIL